MKYNDLSPEAKEHALEQYRDFSVDYDWWSYLLDWWKDQLADLGYGDAEIQFTGFSSQGDGASFTASSVPSHASDPVVRAAWDALQQSDPEWFMRRAASVLLDAPDNDSELEDLASGSVIRICHQYAHENTVSVSWQIDDAFPEGPKHLQDKLDGALVGYYEGLICRVRDLCRTIYRELEKEYEWWVADEQVAESLTVNNYEFDEEGNMI